MNYQWIDVGANAWVRADMVTAVVGFPHADGGKPSLFVAVLGDSLPSRVVAPGREYDVLVKLGHPLAAQFAGPR